MNGKVRNKPCPCGSGLKFKKCCMDKATGAFITPETVAQIERGIADMRAGDVTPV